MKERVAARLTAVRGACEVSCAGARLVGRDVGRKKRGRRDGGGRAGGEREGGLEIVVEGDGVGCWM